MGITEDLLRQFGLIDDSEAIAKKAEETERWGNELHQAATKLEGITTTLGGMSSSGFSGLAKSALSSGKDIERLQKEINKLKKEANITDVDFSGFAKAAKTFKPGDIKNQLKSVMSTARSEIMGVFSAISKEAGDTGDVLAGIGTIGLAEINKRVIESLGNMSKYNEVQEILTKIQKGALQAGIAFGESFSGAGKDVAAFNTSLTNTTRTTQANRDEILAVRKALAQAFGGKETHTSLNLLKENTQKVQSAINLTNIALTVSKATGIEATAVAGMLSDVHLQLGGTLEETALSFGHIRDASKDSGLTFDSVAGSIIGSAKALKFYGTTTEAVTPIFKKFNQSLTGIGAAARSELMETFVKQIGQMSTGTRAFLSLSSQGGAGGGLLGGSLKMEKAMETGEGMGDIAQSISETIKKFGGGKILTREDALASPGSERNFIIQRQILGQLTGMSDTAQQNQMMKVMQDIDKHGLDASGSAEASFGEMMAAGEAVAAETTTDAVKATLQVEQAVNSQGGVIVERLKEISRKIGLPDLQRSVDSFLNSATSGGGAINFDKMKEMLSGRDKSITSALENTNLGKGQKRSLEREQKQVQKQMGKITAGETITNAKSKYDEELKKAVRGMGDRGKDKFVNTGQVGKEQHKSIMQRATAPLEERKGQINKRLGAKDIGVSERNELRAERRALNEGIKEWKRSLNKTDKVEESKAKNRDTRQKENVENAIEANKRRLERKRTAGITTTDRSRAVPSSAAEEQERAQKAITQASAAAQMRVPEIPTGARDRSGLDSDVRYRVPGAPSDTDIAAVKTTTPEKTEHTIILKLEVDSAGRLVTEEKSKQIASNIAVKVVRGYATGTNEDTPIV